MNWEIKSFFRVVLLILCSEFIVAFLICGAYYLLLGKEGIVVGLVLDGILGIGFHIMCLYMLIHSFISMFNKNN